VAIVKILGDPGPAKCTAVDEEHERDHEPGADGSGEEIQSLEKVQREKTVVAGLVPVTQTSWSWGLDCRRTLAR
jgi:hypothetical protein